MIRIDLSCEETEEHVIQTAEKLKKKLV